MNGYIRFFVFVVAFSVVYAMAANGLHEWWQGAIAGACISIAGIAAIDPFGDWS